ILHWAFTALSIFYLGLLGILINRLHLLSILLCLELLLISIFFTINILAFNTSPHLISASIILLALSASEASTGLSLMVALSRTHNSDLVNNINILQQ
uniref:NADH dehdrogenase subunit 4L n=1 Tax=Henricia reniossa TaxID=2053902 RepID=UPI0030E3DD7F